MRKTYLITLLLCCFSALLNGAVSPFSFSSLKMEEGLSQLSVLKIHQDKSGFMWFATRNGLNRYDGNSFVVYKHSNGDSLSLSSNHVTALAEDDRGNLWVGTMNGLNRRCECDGKYCYHNGTCRMHVSGGQHFRNEALLERYFLA